MEIVTGRAETTVVRGARAVVEGFNSAQCIEVLGSVRNFIFCLCLLAVFDAAPAVVQPKAGGAPAAPASPAPPVSAEACYAGYGLKPAQKIKICSDVIDSGSVKGPGLGLSYFNRGQALSNSGDPKGADEALKLLPNNIDAHDTRGFIYL